MPGRSGPSLVPEQADALPANVSLLFESPDRRRLTTRRWGMPDLVLDGLPLTEFCSRFLRAQGCSLRDVREVEVFGLPAVTADFSQTGRHRMDWRMGRAWRGTATMWRSAEGQRIYAFEEVGPTDHERVRVEDAFAPWHEAQADARRAAQRQLPRIELVEPAPADGPRFDLAAQLASVPLRNRGVETQAESPDGRITLTVRLQYPRWMAPLKRLLRLRDTRVCRLDPVGAGVYRRIDGHRTFGRLLNEFAAEHALTFFESRALLSHYVAGLMKRGLVVVGIQSARLTTHVRGETTPP